MIYNAEDKWNNNAPHLEHRSHKYYMKIGKGSNARYFYSAQEYAAYQAAQRGGLNSRQASERAAMANARERMSEASRMRRLTDRYSKQADARLKSEREKAAKNSAYDNRSKMQKTNDKRNAYYRKQNEERMQKNARDMEFRKRKEKIAKELAIIDSRRTPKNGDERVRREKERARFRKKMRAKYAVKNTINNVTNKATNTYNSVKKAAKKAYNSKQGKTVRKRVKKTAQSAYKRGSSFVKRLFGR